MEQVSYQFVDPRDGEYGVCYSKPTLEQAQEVAAKVGYSGEIRKVVTPAFQPIPPRGENDDRYDLPPDFDENFEIPF